MSESMTLAWTTMRRRTTDAVRTFPVPAVFAPVALAAFTLTVYLVTLAPDLYSLDSPELAAAAHTLGIAHAPGYPLYTLAGWLFSHAFPAGTVAFKLNLLSALFASAAVVLTYAVALRITRRPLAAAAAALMLGFSYYFWAVALAAEVYTLDVALFAGMVLAALAWREQRSPVLALLVGLMLGLAMATRTTALLYVPALAVFAWMSGERSPRSWAAAAGGIAAGLAFYAYLPLRSAAGVDVGPGDYGLDGSLAVYDLSTWSGFWRHVSASDFRSDAFAYGPAGVLRETGIFAAQLTGSFLVVGVPLGIAGAVRMWRSDRALTVLLAGCALPVAAFFVNYGTLDKEYMFLPAYAVWAVFIAAGIAWALDEAADAPPALAWGAALLLPVAMLAVNLPLVSLHDERGIRSDAEAFLAQAEEGAIVYGPFLDVAPYQYLQQVEDQRPDIALVNNWTVDSGFVMALADANVGRVPLYVTRDEPALRRIYRLVPIGERSEEEGVPLAYQVLPREAAQ